MWSKVPLGTELRAELGPPRRVRTLASSPRSRVWRAEFGGARAVVKQLVAGAGADERFGREVAALRAAASANPPVVPRLLGTDPEQRVLVIEYVEAQTPSADWQIGYAAALGRLHAVPTAEVRLPAWAGPTVRDVEAFLKLAAQLGTPASDAVGAELEALCARLAARSDRRQLLHGDPCPANDLHTADGVRFVDFEQASLGDGTVELAYLRIGFPTCWCSTAAAPGLVAEAEAAYQEASGRQATADEIADACAGWLIRGDALVERARRETTDHLARMVEQDWTWGTATARERLAHRLGVVAALIEQEQLGQLAETAQLAAGLRAAMLKRWPDLRPLPERRP
ncbi:MAG: aminoglycoside phosphotransferase family protein [Catenulispora sp.]|nr:aminoglycoside phosphotransferase family protein [Catenulispora sp.]